MTKVVEKNVAEIIIIAIATLILMSSCASTNYSTNPAYAGWRAGCGGR